MAIKGIKIGDSLPDEQKTSGIINTNFTTIYRSVNTKQTDGSYSVDIFPIYHRTEAACGGNKVQLVNWAALTSIYTVIITEAEFDDATKASNDLLFDKLFDAMGTDFSTLTKINKS